MFEHSDGYHQPQDLNDASREKVLYYYGLIEKLYRHPYGPKLRVELVKISAWGW